MSKKNLPGKKTGNAADEIQSPESETRLLHAQLLSVIEFSRKFPDLTQHLAAVRNCDDADQRGASTVSSDEPLEFPPLIAPDPREIKPRLPDADSGGKLDDDAAELDDEFALFAAGRLPPPEPVGKPDEQKKKKKIFWKFLLPLTLLLLFLLWMNEAAPPVSSANSTQQRR